MKRVQLLLVLVVFQFFVLHAQSVFQPGFVITLENDTVYGLIENNSYAQNAVYCVFKKSETTETINYSALDIKSYQFVGGKYYSSEKVGEKPMFLEYLVKGKLNLFFNRDIDGNNHFYVSKDNIPLTELYISKSILGENNEFSVDNSQFAFSVDGEKSFQSKKYIGVLKYYTENHPKLIKDIDNVGLTHQSLIKVVSKYNSLFEDVHTESAYVKKFKRKIIVETLGGFTSFNILVDNSSGLNLIPQSPFYPSYGLQVLFQQTERSENVYLGLGFQRYGMLFEKAVFLRVPLSVNYLSQKKGFSPTFSYQIDLDKLPLYQKAEVGLKYQYDKFSLKIAADIHTRYFVKLYGLGTQLGLSYKF